MKFLHTNSAFLVLLFLATAMGQSHNIEWGEKGNNDRQIYREIFPKEYSFMKILTENVTYQGHNKITYIKATDQYVNGNGGYATLVSGGTGYNEVVLNLKSQRNHGYNFIIEMWGSNSR